MKIDYIVFTDASLVTHRKEKYASYGVVVLNPNTNKYVTFKAYLGDKSISYSELRAILRGLQYVNNLVNKLHVKHCNIMVVSDSKSTVMNLSEYIYQWNKKTDKWRGYSGKKVKHQEMYKEIYKTYIINNFYDVKFVHIRSHMRESDIGDLTDYLKNNGVTLNDSTTRVFIRMNALADKLATSVTEEYKRKNNWSYKLLKKEV